MFGQPFREPAGPSKSSPYACLILLLTCVQERTVPTGLGIFSGICNLLFGRLNTSSWSELYRQGGSPELAKLYYICPRLNRFYDGYN